MPPPSQPPSPPPPRAPDTRLGAPAVVASTFVVAGSVDAFDASAFRAALAAQFPMATDIALNVSAASVLVVVRMSFLSATHADAARIAVRETTVEEMQATWFAGTGITIEALIPPPGVAANLTDAASMLSTTDGGVAAAEQWSGLTHVVVPWAAGAGTLALCSVGLCCVWRRRRKRQRPRRGQA